MNLGETSLFDNGQPLRETMGLPIDFGIDRGATGTTAFGFEPPGGGGITEVPLAIDDATRAMEDLIEQIDIAIERYDLFGSVASAASEAIGAAANAGVISQKSATKALLLLNAVQSIQLGMIEQAKAVAAAASGAYWKAALHGIAAGLFYSAAAFNGSAAFGGGGSGGGGNLDLGRDADQGDTRVQQVTYIFQGTPVFFGGNKDSVVRDLSEWMRRAQER